MMWMVEKTIRLRLRNIYKLPPATQQRVIFLAGPTLGPANPCGRSRPKFFKGPEKFL
ncbi:hypothetical protein HanPI659440_Chr00c07g0718221 [Helianthus annuus]|nr:hypothetical protein HanPI659440_Chr00c07g0718221 [Helianthus annuus]